MQRRVGVLLQSPCLFSRLTLSCHAHILFHRQQSQIKHKYSPPPYLFIQGEWLEVKESADTDRFQIPYLRFNICAGKVVRKPLFLGRVKVGLLLSGLQQVGLRGVRSFSNKTLKRDKLKLEIG